MNGVKGMNADAENVARLQFVPREFLDGLINQPKPLYVTVSRGDSGQHRQGPGRDEGEIDSLGGRRRVGKENFEFS